MEINNNRHNILSSTISPNPASVKYWADLLTDPMGGTLKYWDGLKWELVNKPESAGVTKVNEKTGDVVLSGADIKLDKTSPLNLNSAINSINDSIKPVTTTTNGVMIASDKTKLNSLVNFNDSELRELISALTLRVSALETVEP